MDNGSFLVQALTTVGYLLPQFIACAVGLVLLANSARPGVARSRGYLGIALLLACVLLHLVFGLYQAWLIDQAATTGTGQLPMQLGVLGVLRFGADGIGAAGLIVLVVGLCRASRESAADEPSLPPALPGS